MSADPSRIAQRYLAKHPKRSKTAGEVRFIKDRGGDEKQWGWGTPGPSKREIAPEYKFSPTNIKPLARALRATVMAMGHCLSAYSTFTRVKSATVSPDGALGGRGYIQKIADMRRAYMNCAEALSSLSDTLYDEINAPHWNPAIEEQDPRERQEVQDIMEGVEDIREDPEEWAQEEEKEVAGSTTSDPTQSEADAKKTSKTASVPGGQMTKRIAARYLGRGE